jgi:uncharacterized OsmC-like protein
MGIKARGMGFDLDNMKVSILKTMKADPRRVTGIRAEFEIPTELIDLDEKSKIILKNTGETCPVIKSLHPDIAVEIDWGLWSS